MFIDPIAHHATRQPHAIAASLPSADITYARFDATINAIANELRGKVPRGSRVVLLVGSHYLHWALIFAVGRLGGISVSTDPSKHAQVLDLIKPDVILSETAFTSPWQDRVVAVDVAWLRERAENGDTKPLADLPGLDAPARISLSSGTTGTPKMLLFTHGQIQRRLKSGGFGELGRFHERLLCILGIDTFGGYITTLRSWWAGGTVCMFRPMTHLIVSRNVTGIAASPRQIAALVSRLPPGFRPPPHLAVALGGSRISRELSRAVRLRLSANVTTSYGSTETGGMATMPLGVAELHPQASGIVLPWNEVQIVDQSGNVLPEGEVGEVRMRSPDMATSYLDDPEATSKYFRDGWFYPGDVGSLAANGILSIVGRVDDVANIGGVKVAPDTIEEALASIDGIVDVGAFMTREEPPRIVAAIVTTGTPDLEAARKVVNQRLASGSVPLTFWQVAEIPRNSMGKVERAALRAQALQARDRAAAAQAANRTAS